MSSISDDVKDTIDSRCDLYGAPENSFQVIADFWDAYIRYRILRLNKGETLKVTCLDVTHMMSLFKHGRMLGQKPNRDNYVDACGYLTIAADWFLSSKDPKE